VKNVGGDERRANVADVLVARPQAEDEAAPLLGPPCAHHGCVDGPAERLERAVRELGEHEEEEAKTMVTLDHAARVEQLDRAEAHRRAEEANADQHVLTEPAMPSGRGARRVSGVEDAHGRSKRKMARSTRSRAPVGEPAGDERARGVREHEARVHLREDRLVDAGGDELGLDGGVALAREMRDGIIHKGHEEDRSPPGLCAGHARAPKPEPRRPSPAVHLEFHANNTGK